MKKLLGIGGALLALAMACAPQTVGESAREALVFCGKTLIPSLFPFFVCANVLVGSGMTEVWGNKLAPLCRTLFAVGGEGASVILLGLISGYPAGAALTCRLYTDGRISEGEARRLLAFTNHAGPLFVMGVIGIGVYGSREIGYLLLGAQTLAAITTGICMRFYGPREIKSGRKTKKGFGDPMGDAVHTLLSLCAFVVFFSVIIAFLEKSGILQIMHRLLLLTGMGEQTARVLARGGLEISAAGRWGQAALPAMAGLLSFGGVSVFLQTVMLTRKAGLPVRSYGIGKLLSAGFSSLYCRLLLEVCPLLKPTGMAAGISQHAFSIPLITGILLAMTFYGGWRLFGKKM